MFLISQRSLFGLELARNERDINFTMDPFQGFCGGTNFRKDRNCYQRFHDGKKEHQPTERAFAYVRTYTLVTEWNLSSNFWNVFFFLHDREDGLAWFYGFSMPLMWVDRPRIGICKCLRGDHPALYKSMEPGNKSLELPFIALSIQK